MNEDDEQAISAEDTPVHVSRDEAALLYKTYDQVPLQGPDAKMLAASLQVKVTPLLQ